MHNPTNAEIAATIRQTARVVSIGLRNTFRGVSSREALIFEGPNGFTEWAPFVEYDDEESRIWLQAAIEFAFAELPGLNRTRIPINATLAAVAPELVESALKPFGEFRTVKIKVAQMGHSIQNDLDRILKVVESYPAAKIRLDANGGFEVEQALELTRLLHKAGVQLEYFEQPCKTIAELAEFRIKAQRIDSSILVAADESVRKVSDPLAVAQAGAADILVMKVAPLGGIRRALDIAADAGLPVVVSSAIDTSVGISMGLHLAAALPELDYDCGLGTAAMMIGDLTREPLIAKDGFLDVQRVRVDETKLEVFAAEDHRTDWWLERLDRCLGF